MYILWDFVVDPNVDEEKKISFFRIFAMLLRQYIWLKYYQKERTLSQILAPRDH